MTRTPRIGERVYWEPMTDGAPIIHGRVSFVSPTAQRDAYRVTIDWDVPEGEGPHATMHHMTSTSHVKFADQKEAANV